MEDLNSQNGTFVNEKKIETCELNDGNQILIGKHILVFTKEASAQQKVTVPQTEDKTLFLDTKKHRELLKRDEKGVI